jgi:hypothetical protein
LQKIEALEKQSEYHQWNIDECGDDLLICRNEHEKGESCEYVRYTIDRPLTINGELQAKLERELETERDAANFYAKRVARWIEKHDGVKASLDFYKRRVDALHEWQSKMRDPERKIVCDILANGCTLEPTRAKARGEDANAMLEAAGVPELLDQATEIDFDDVDHIAISSDDACDMRGLIEKILSEEEDSEGLRDDEMYDLIEKYQGIELCKAVLRKAGKK